MASVEIQWTVPGKSQGDIVLGFDPSTEDANGNVVVNSASGTYSVLNSGGNVVRTDQVTGLIAANSYLFAPDDKVNVAGINPVVDTAGVGVIINNATDADNVGPNNTPQVVFSTDIFGDYEELQKGPATNVALGVSGTGGGGGSGGTGGGGSGGTGGGGSGGGGSADAVTVTTGPNGRTLVDIGAPDQTVTSAYFDVFKNHGQADTTFVFDPGYGVDVVRGMVVDGPDHDTLSLPSSDFASLGQVLRQTQQTALGAVIVDPAADDGILLLGVSKADLAANRQQDITIHP